MRRRWKKKKKKKEKKKKKNGIGPTNPPTFLPPRSKAAEEKLN